MVERREYKKIVSKILYLRFAETKNEENETFRNANELKAILLISVNSVDTE